MESCERMNTIACSTKDEIKPCSSSSSTVWSEMPEPTGAVGEVTLPAALGAGRDSFNPIELVEVKQEDLEDFIDVKPELLPCKEDLPSDAALEVACQGDVRRPSPSCLTSAEELLMVDHWMVPSEGHHQAHTGMEALDESNERNAMEANSLMNQKKYSCPQCDYQVDPCFCTPASTEKLAICPPVLSRVETSPVEETVTKVDSVVEAVLPIDQMLEQGMPLVFLYNCARCSFGSNHRHSIRKHVKIHERIKTKHLVCPQCEYKTSDKRNLQSHVLIHSNNRTKDLCCSHCPYTTDRPNCLQRHLLRHLPNKDKPFSCAHCPFRTAIKNTLSQHLRIHDSNRGKKFSCTHCLYSTDKEYTYQRHLRTHDSSRPKPFACPKCNYRTDLKSCLKTHLLYHEDKRLACPRCPFTTIYKQNYKKHQLIHDAKAKLLACSKCLYSTHSKGHYQSHLTRHETARSRLNLSSKIELLSSVPEP